MLPKSSGMSSIEDAAFSTAETLKSALYFFVAQSLKL
jgi:hypothetical protein